jgi:Family of unknown function (DUF6529)
MRGMSHATPSSSAPSPSTAPAATKLLVPILVGALVAVALGAYGRAHDPDLASIPTLGFSSVLAMKSALASVALVLAVVQVVSALRMYGRIGSGPASRTVTRVHRTSGVLAVLVTLPVAYACLWGIGFETITTRVLAHSLLGCVFYGVFVAKMLTLKTKRVPGWALPWLGGLTFAALVGIWLTSALWYFTTNPSY